MALGNLTVNLVANDTGLEDALNEVAEASREVSSTLENLDESLSDIRDSMQTAGASAKESGDDIRNISQDTTIAGNSIENLSDEVQKLTATLQGGNTSLSKASKETKNLGLSASATQSQVGELGQQAAKSSPQVALLAEINDKLAASATKAGVSSKAAAGGVDDLGDESSEAAGQMLTASSAADLLSLKSSALSINVGAFTIALRNLTTQVPLLVASLGNLGAAFTGLATAVGGVGIGGLAASLGGMLAKAKENGANLNSLESVMQSLSSTSQQLQERLLAAFMPVVEMEGSIATFEGLIDSLVTSVNSFSRALATTFTVDVGVDGHQNLSTTLSGISEAFNNNIDRITGAIGDLVIVLGDDVESLAESFFQGLPQFLDRVSVATEQMINIISRATENFGGFLQQVTRLGRAIGSGIAPVLNAFFGVVRNIVDALVISNKEFNKAANSVDKATESLSGFRMESIATAVKVGALLLAVNRIAAIMGTLIAPIAAAAGKMALLASQNSPIAALFKTLAGGSAIVKNFVPGIESMATAFRQVLPPLNEDVSVISHLNNKLNILSGRSISSTISLSSLQGALKKAATNALSFAQSAGIAQAAMSGLTRATAPLAAAMAVSLSKARVALGSLQSSMIATNSASELLGNALSTLFVRLGQVGSAIISVGGFFQSSLITSLKGVTAAAVNAGSAIRTFGVVTRAALTGIGVEDAVNRLSKLTGLRSRISAGVGAGNFDLNASGFRSALNAAYVQPAKDTINNKLKQALESGKKAFSSFSLFVVNSKSKVVSGFRSIGNSAIRAGSAIRTFGVVTRAALTGIGVEDAVNRLSKLTGLRSRISAGVGAGNFDLNASGFRSALNTAYIQPARNTLTGKLPDVFGTAEKLFNGFTSRLGGLSDGFGKKLTSIATGPLLKLQNSLGVLQKLSDRSVNFGIRDLGKRAFGAVTGITSLNGSLGLLKTGLSGLAGSIVSTIPFTSALDSSFLKLTNSMLTSGGAITKLGAALQTIRSAIVGNISVTGALTNITVIYNSSLNTLITKLLAGGSASRFFGTTLQLLKAATLGNITATAALKGVLSAFSGVSASASVATLALASAKTIAFAATSLLSGGVSVLTGALTTLASVLAVVTGGLIVVVAIVGTAAAALGALGQSGNSAESIITKLTSTLKNVGSAVMPAVIGSANVMMDIFNSILTPVKALISGFKQVGVALGLISEDAGGNGIMPMLSGASNALQDVLNDVGRLARLFGSFLTSKIETATSVITSLVGENEGKVNDIKSTVSELSSEFTNLIGPVKSFGKQILSTAVPVVENLIGTFIGLGQKIIGVFTGDGGISEYLDMITRVQDAIMSGVGPALDFLSVLFTGIAKSVDMVVGIISGALSILIGVFGFIVEAIGGVIGALTGTEDKGGSLMSTLASGVELLMSGFNSLIGGLTTIMNFFIQLYNVVSPILGFIFNLFMNIAGIVGGILIDALVGLASIARSVAVSITDAFMNNFGFIIDGMMDVINFIDAGIQSIIDGFLSIPEAVAGFWNNTIGGMEIEIGGEKLMDVPTIDAGGMGSGGGSGGKGDSDGGGSGLTTPSIEGSNLGADEISSGAGVTSSLIGNASNAVSGGMGSGGNVTVNEGNTRNIFNQTISANPEDEVQMGRIAEDAMAEANSFKRRQEGSQ